MTLNMPDLVGHDLGSCTRSFEMRDALLYNLMAGAPPEALDLTYERDATVLPTYACALGTWAVEAAGDLGAYDRFKSLHASQQLEVRGRLEPGEIEMTGHVEAVWDKGSAGVAVIAVEAEAFVARYTIFVPGAGGWGGERGPSAPRGETLETPTWSEAFRVPDNWAAIYRLTGDYHPVHIDPVAAQAMGLDRPILHGLCTLAIAARAAAAACDADPLDLDHLDLKFAQPVFPGDVLELAGRAAGDGSVQLSASVGGRAVLSGRAEYGV